MTDASSFRRWLPAILLALGVGCADDPLPPVDAASDDAVDAHPEDAAEDRGIPVDRGRGEVGADAARDAGRDAGADTGLDAGSEVGTDAGSDAGTDLGGDVVADAGSDAGSDIGFDIGRDVSVDIGRDVGVDVGRDVGVDVGFDAGPPPWGIDTRPSNRTCVAFARPTAGTSVRLTPVFGQLPTYRQATGLWRRPGDATTWYLTLQTGQLYRFDNAAGANRLDTVIDLSRVVDARGEGGLLGVAFHPDFARNGQVFVSYTAPARNGSEEMVSRVARYRSADGGRTLTASSAEVILEVSQPFINHKGGGIAFGPDGFLYVGLGDGGSANDPMRHGQNVNSLLGKMLRIDVNTAAAPRRYGIPADNPFARGGGAPEIFAWGLRNPWRWSFDRVSGELWAGDVGQGALEEVDLIRRGGNYGWYGMEGTRCQTAVCPIPGAIPPVVEYARALGASITGGYVYRGRAIPWLVGRYVFGDFVSGRLFAVFTTAAGAYEYRELLSTAQNISSFGEDADGELYVVNYNGSIGRIDPPAANPADTVPATIRATGCVDATNPLLPAAGLIPYAPVAPFWSDGADKSRYLALPDGARITVNADGDFDLPVGTVLVKHFDWQGRRIETRLFVRHSDGQWAGYTYRWNDAQTDAAALPGSDVRDLPGGPRWFYPSRSQCMECHTAAAGRTLGLELAQLNSAIVYPSTGRRANQLATLEHIGLFAAALPRPPAQLPALVDPGGSAPVDQRARAYLHTNCSHCHRPGGVGRGSADLRWTQPFATTGLCNAAPTAGDLGVSGARLVVPGDQSRSLVWLRATATDASRMPPIGSGVVDPVGSAVLQGWIRSLANCN